MYGSQPVLQFLVCLERLSEVGRQASVESNRLTVFYEYTKHHEKNKIPDQATGSRVLVMLNGHKREHCRCPGTW